MQHDVASYEKASQFLANVDQQFAEHLLVKMEDDLDRELAEFPEDDYKGRAKFNKAGKRAIKEVGEVYETIYPDQVQFMQMRTNLSFLLENAHNKVSYPALAGHFAEYEFVAKEIKKAAKKCGNEAMKDFLAQSTVLETDFFQLMMDTVKVMQNNVLNRMNQRPDQYIDLNPEVDAELDVDVVKAAYKAKIKKLKEDKAKLG